MAAKGRVASERAVEQSNVLDQLLREREGLIGALDRVLALRGTAQLIRETLGAHAAFVGELARPRLAVVRWMSGNRTEAMQNLPVPAGQGIGGRALALRKPVRVQDYWGCPAVPTTRTRAWWSPCLAQRRVRHGEWLAVGSAQDRHRDHGAQAFLPDLRVELVRDRR